MLSLVLLYVISPTRSQKILGLVEVNLQKMYNPEVHDEINLNFKLSSPY